MGNHVFICYAREDQEFVFKLATTLKDLGVPVWLDQWDIPLGADWDQAIDSTLNECLRFLIVLSPTAVASREVRGELRTALDVNKPIVPVLHQACKIPRQLRMIQYVDFTACGLDDEAALHRVVHALRVPGIEAVPPPREVEQEQKQRAVEEARRRMAEVKQGLEALTQWAGARWAEAGEQEAGAEQARQVQDYGRAAERYARACQLYEAARVEAEEERGRQQAIEARRQAEEAQKAAEEAEAQRYIQELYERAEEAMRQGEQSLNANRWEEATNEFVKAREFFGDSLEGAKRKRAKAKQAAEAARDSTLVEHRKAQGGGASELFPDGFAEAVALLHQAEQKLNQGDYSPAQAIFERSTALFRQVYDEAVVYFQREQAKEARARAHESQGRAPSSKKGWQQRRAQKTLAQGDPLFQQGNYAEARVKYEEAISLFSALLETSVAAPAEHKIALVSRPSLYAVFILGLLFVVIILYLHPSYRETLSEIAEGKKALEQGDLGLAEEQKRLAEGVHREAEAKRLAEEQRRRAQGAQMETLLTKARQALAANRLTTPAGDNSVEYAEQLLVLAPKHGGARQVLIEVVGRYVAQGEVALSQGNLAGAQGYRDMARQLASQYGLQNTEVERLAERIDSEQKQQAESTPRKEEDQQRLAEQQQAKQAAQAKQIDTLIQNAQQALAANRLTTPAGDNAAEYAGRVLAMQAGHPRAIRILQEAVGRYVALGEVALSAGKLDNAKRYQRMAEKLVNSYGLPDAELRKLAARVLAKRQERPAPTTRPAEPATGRTAAARPTERAGARTPQEKPAALPPPTAIAKPKAATTPLAGDPARDQELEQLHQQIEMLQEKPEELPPFIPPAF